MGLKSSINSRKWIWSECISGYRTRQDLRQRGIGPVVERETVGAAGEESWRDDQVSEGEKVHEGEKPAEVEKAPEGTNFF